MKNIEKETLFSFLKSSAPPYKNEMGLFVIDELNGLPLYVASYFETYDKPLVIVTSNLYKANIIFNSLVSYMPTKKILLFPSDDMMKSEVYSTNKEFMSSRVYALNEILNGHVDIIITNVSALMRKYPSPELFRENSISFSVGHSYNFESIRKTLAKMGYINVSKIDQTFQYSVRGDIIDVFSLNYDNPVRLEFFDDELESIRFFDIATQEKTKELKKVEF
ncbi:MAG: hypothetical protein LUD22_04585, partial [Coprobacillus sp.]|nr:hypothetical protein [Coprobacillus sp.]